MESQYAGINPQDIYGSLMGIRMNLIYVLKEGKTIDTASKLKYCAIRDDSSRLILHQELLESTPDVEPLKESCEVLVCTLLNGGVSQLKNLKEVKK